MCTQADYVASHIVDKLQALPTTLRIAEYNLKPAFCSYQTFDAALKIARQRLTIESRVVDGELYFRGCKL